MRLLFVLASMALAACGLSVVGESEPVSDAGPGATVDSGPDDALPSRDEASISERGAVVEGGALVDAPALKDVTTGCTTLVEDSLSGLDTRKWQLLGSAQTVGTSVQLTSFNTSGQAGAVWWKTPLTFTGSLRVTVSYTDQPASGSGGDGEGIAIAWASQIGLGDQARSTGICASNLDGVAALLSFSQDQIQGVAGIHDICVTNGSTPVNDGLAGTFGALFTSTNVLAQLGNVIESIPATVAKTGFVGFTASTGSNDRSGINITTVKVESCP